MKLHKIVTATGLVMLIGCISACGTVSSSGSAATDKSMDVYNLFCNEFIIVWAFPVKSLPEVLVFHK